MHITDLKTCPTPLLRKCYVAAQYNKLRRSGMGISEAKRLSRQLEPAAIAKAGRERRDYIMEMAFRKGGATSPEKLRAIYKAILRNVQRRRPPITQNQWIQFAEWYAKNMGPKEEGSKGAVARETVAFTVPQTQEMMYGKGAYVPKAFKPAASKAKRKLPKTSRSRKDEPKFLEAQKQDIAKRGMKLVQKELDKLKKQERTLKQMQKKLSSVTRGKKHAGPKTVRRDRVQKTKAKPQKKGHNKPRRS